MTCSTSKKIGTIEFRLDTHHSRPHSWRRRARPPSKDPRRPIMEKGRRDGRSRAIRHPRRDGGSRGGMAAGF